MKKSILPILLFASILSKANNIQLSNVILTGSNAASAYTLINFDIKWDNSWRVAAAPSNYDAAWVFVKWRKQGSLVWNHATLNTTGHTAPAGATIDTPTDGKGIFIYRSANGTGTNNWAGAKIRWNYGADGLASVDFVEIYVAAIEMVYIPQSSFYAGDGSVSPTNSIMGQFESKTSGTPFQVTSESTPGTLGGGGAGSMGNNNRTGMDAAGLDDFNDATSKVLPGAFPKGYNDFYVMKYEVSQEQYVEFLNKLTYTQQARRTIVSPASIIGLYALDNSYRNGIVIKSSGTNPGIPASYACNLNGNGVFNEIDDGQNVACNWLHFADCEAYMDWAGLRPITELEYEKACRGPVIPVKAEYAWGSTTITSATATALNNSGKNNEIPSNSSSNCSYMGAYSSGHGPLRVGSFAQSATSRQSSGASYYGVMDMSGNLREMVITVGNATGRAFTGVSGDGVLAANGEASVANWPTGFQADVSNAVGAGYRGGDWSEQYIEYLSVSGRNTGAYSYKYRDPDYGIRGGRTAP